MGTASIHPMKSSLLFGAISTSIYLFKHGAPGAIVPLLLAFVFSLFVGFKALEALTIKGNPSSRIGKLISGGSVQQTKNSLYVAAVVFLLLHAFFASKLLLGEGPLPGSTLFVLPVGYIGAAIVASFSYPVALLIQKALRVGNA